MEKCISNADFKVCVPHERDTELFSHYIFIFMMVRNAQCETAYNLIQEFLLMGCPQKENKAYYNKLKQVS